jgi:hypothetical protein
VRDHEDDSDVLIECRDVYKSFGEKKILNGVSFKVITSLSLPYLSFGVLLDFLYVIPLILMLRRCLDRRLSYVLIQ